MVFDELFVIYDAEENVQVKSLIQRFVKVLFVKFNIQEK